MFLQMESSAFVEADCGSLVQQKRILISKEVCLWKRDSFNNFVKILEQLMRGYFSSFSTSKRWVAI